EALYSGAVDHEDVMPRGGYKTVVDHLAKGLDIHTSQPVRRIEQSSETVTVHAGEHTFEGTHAIVTVPLGVMKAKTIAFDPPLPTAHQGAIDRTGFGALEKVALAYERAVWQVEGQPTHLTIVESPRPEWPEILDFSAWYDVPVVVGMATGSFGRALAAMPE